MHLDDGTNRGKAGARGRIADAGRDAVIVEVRRLPAAVADEEDAIVQTVGMRVRHIGIGAFDPPDQVRADEEVENPVDAVRGDAPAFALRDRIGDVVGGGRPGEAGQGFEHARPHRRPLLAGAFQRLTRGDDQIGARARLVVIMRAHAPKVGERGRNGKRRERNRRRGIVAGVEPRLSSRLPARPRHRLQRALGRLGRFAALAGLGAWLGALASAGTTTRMRQIVPPPNAAPAPMFDDGAAAIAESASLTDEPARRWARQAFDVGLRDCPRITPDFAAVCRAQMAEEARLAAAAAKAQAEFAATFDYQDIYVPEPAAPAEPPAWRPAAAPAAGRDPEETPSAEGTAVLRSVRGAAVQIVAERQDGDAEQGEQDLVRRMPHGQRARHDAEPDAADRRRQGVTMFD